MKHGHLSTVRTAVNVHNVDLKQRPNDVTKMSNDMLVRHVRSILLVGAVFSTIHFAPVRALEPDFLYPLENVTIAQGRDASFTCVVNNLGGYRVSSGTGVSSSSGSQGSAQAGLEPPAPFTRVAWIKADTKAILAIHEHVITNNARLSVTHNDYNTWTLHVRNVRREDRGMYMCQVNTDPMKMQTAFLEVVIPPDIVYEETSGDMMVPEGGSAKLVCKARGYPKPKITWRREDGGEIIARGTANGKTRSAMVEGEMLSLTKVTRGEMGAYLCIAANGVPPSVSKRMMLLVHFHPLIQVPNQLVGAPLGTDVTLQCHVEASPKAINYWTRESGEMIISNDKYEMSENNLSYYSVQMKLTIKKLHRSDLGGYRCISKNSIGDAEGNIRLYEMELQLKKKTVDSNHVEMGASSDQIFDENDSASGLNNGPGGVGGGSGSGGPHQVGPGQNNRQLSLREPGDGSPSGLDDDDVDEDVGENDVATTRARGPVLWIGFVIVHAYRRVL